MTSTTKHMTAAIGVGSAMALASGLLATNPAQAAPGTAVVERGGAVARTAPSPFAPQQARLAGGARVTVGCWVPGGDRGEAREQRWYKYDVEGMPSAWVPQDSLRRVGRAVARCSATTVYGSPTTRLVLRTGPSTRDAARAVLPARSDLRLVCRVESRPVHGNKVWYLTGEGGWVSSRYVETNDRAPLWCTRAR